MNLLFFFGGGWSNGGGAGRAGVDATPKEILQ